MDLEVSSEPNSDSEDLDNNSELDSSLDLEVSSEPNSDSEDLDNNSELDSSLDLEVSSEPNSDSEDLDNNSELDSSMDLEVSSEPNSDSEDLDNNSELDSLDLEVSSEPSSDSEDESSFSDMEGNSSIEEEDPVLAERERFRRVMCKTKPVSTWNCDMELMHREHNFINRIGWRGGHTSDQSFGEGYHKSGQVLGQLTLWNTLKPRYAKCLNFNQDGDLLCAGTDDHIIVWNWAKNRTLTNYRPDIKGKIMQIKFIDSAGSLDIVSASSDGQMLRTIVPPSGGAPMSSHCLYEHIGCVRDFEIVPRSRHEILSAGDYGIVKLFDLRVSSAATTAVQCVETREGVDLYTIAHHPFAPEFCVGGDDVKLNVYDKRKMTRAVHEITPRNLKDSNSDNKPDITSAVYNHSGSELLACYRRTGNYLFDSRNYTDGDFLHYYRKHFREINFFGPRSEYIVSGDFNGIYFWDKNTGEIICENMDEKAKAVICLKPHPWKPMLATAALIKPGIHIWIPNGP